jgi:hypothetical protein
VVDGEAGVVGEERLLPFGVAAVGAVRVRVEELAQSEPVGGLGRGELGMDGDRGTSSEPDQVEAGERVVDLLHLASGRQVAEVDRGEPRFRE